MFKRISRIIILILQSLLEEGGIKQINVSGFELFYVQLGLSSCMLISMKSLAWKNIRGNRCFLNIYISY